METFKTRVVFKIVAGEVVAVLLDVPANKGKVMCYAHVGQHGEGMPSYFRRLRNAKPEEYKGLLSELDSMGYECEVIRSMAKSGVK